MYILIIALLHKHKHVKSTATEQHCLVGNVEGNKIETEVKGWTVSVSL